MGRFREMAENEKILLTILGKFPDTPVKELMQRTSYKRKSSVSRKIEHFKKQSVLLGPMYNIDYGKLCRNPIHVLNCIIEFNQSYETVISYLKTIDSLRWIYPILSPCRGLLEAIFVSTDNKEMKSNLQLLKENNIITDYITRFSCHKRVIVNPNFSGDVNPSLDNLLEPCEIPDTSFGCHATPWNECDIAVLSYLLKGYEYTNLMEILRKERALNRTWTYEKIKYSREKMIRDGLIEKIYIILPFPFDLCADFSMFLKTEDNELTERVLHNFARGSQVYKEYMLCENGGYIGFTCHPQFLTGLMNKLDRIKEITVSGIYRARSIPDYRYYVSQPPELKYFDFENLTLEYPYDMYKEKIKEKMESELHY